MGYDVLRDKQFVKVDEKYLPLVLIADSNLREIYNNAMVTSWCTFGMRETGKPITQTREELLAYADERLQEVFQRSLDFHKEYEKDKEKPTLKDIIDNFGWQTGLYINGSRDTTFGMFKGVFNTGCKKALTIEEIRMVVPSANVILNTYDNELSLSANSTEVLKANIGEAEEYEEKYGKRVYVSINLSARDCRWLRTAYWSKRGSFIVDGVNLSKVCQS